ncbi:MAG: hypothetical protein ACYDBQ_01160 [Thermoplasmatota archaeon]
MTAPRPCMPDRPMAIAGTLFEQPFPDRYRSYRRARPAPYVRPDGRVANPENLALLLVMAQNFPKFGVKRLGAITHWEAILIHHVLRYGVRQGMVERVGRHLYRAVDVASLVSQVAG